MWNFSRIVTRTCQKAIVPGIFVFSCYSMGKMNKFCDENKFSKNQWEVLAWADHTDFIIENIKSENHNFTVMNEV